MALIDKLSAIADAIREKTGKKGKLTLDQMAQDIKTLETGVTNPYIEYLDGKQYRKVKLHNFDRVPVSQFIDSYVFEVYMDASVKEFEAYAFKNCTYLTTLNLHEGLEKLNAYSLQNTGLKDIVLPTTLKELSAYACYGSTKLTSVTFQSKPTIGYQPFQNCTNLTIINVPWSEGEVDGAPWGATKATINYDF